MAYAEKRGKGPRPWRAKYKLPDGTAISESGFDTKSAALAWGRDQEARIREGRWTDPSAGKTTVGEWIDRWVAMQDMGISTAQIRSYLIRRFLRPAWGTIPLSAVTTEAITRWQNALPAKEGISRRTASDARSLLGTILGDAAAHKPPLIPYNPALRPRNRGRKTGRRLQRSPQRAWATPLQALLLAERAALLTGRDDDLTLILTVAYTGLRWGEVIGLEHSHLHPGELWVEWQIREAGTFYRLPPKDDSYRSPNWEPCLPVDLPPFLNDLLTRQVLAHRHQRCACAAQHGGSGRYVFPSSDGSHHRRSNYGRRVFRPACDGRYPPVNGATPRIVTVDATTWPGVPLASWPAITPANQHQFGPDRGFVPPRGRGIRIVPDGTPLSSWLPLVPGLTGHGLRHGHRTWMAEDGIPDVLAEQRLGHEIPGMRGLYAHVSDRMRASLNQALQSRWEDSLRERAAIAHHSPVPLLDELLTPHRRTQPADAAPADRTRRHPAARITPDRPGEDDLPNSSQAV
jgi:integrase